jgi:hypothetical protein
VALTLAFAFCTTPSTETKTGVLPGSSATPPSEHAQSVNCRLQWWVLTPTGEWEIVTSEPSYYPRDGQQWCGVVLSIPGQDDQLHLIEVNPR